MPPKRKVLTRAEKIKKLFSKFEDEILKKENKDYGFAKDVWMVLSALRGPDKNHQSLDTSSKKEATTEVIRYCVLPNLVSKVWFNMGPDTPNHASIRKQLDTSSGDDHFNNHVYLAFLALELKWSEKNDLVWGRGGD